MAFKKVIRRTKHKRKILKSKGISKEMSGLVRLDKLGKRDI